MPNYTRDDPRWVKAESVEAETGDARYVAVVVDGKKYHMKPVEWSDPVRDRNKSDVLISDEQGNWVRVWFYDKDIQPWTPSLE